MQCYSHRDLVAVGICKSCGKGLCPSCAREIPTGLVCSDACADSVEINRQIVERAKGVYSIGRNPKIPVGAWFFGVTGPLCVGIAVALWWGDPSSWPLVSYFGGVGVLFSAFAMLIWRRYRALGLSL